jgi:hypothetical protein
MESIVNWESNKTEPMVHWGIIAFLGRSRPDACKWRRRADRPDLPTALRVLEIDQGSSAGGLPVPPCIRLLSVIDYHRRSRGPSIAPINAHNATITPYQRAMNGIESSGQ